MPNILHEHIPFISTFYFKKFQAYKKTERIKQWTLYIHKLLTVFQVFISLRVCILVYELCMYSFGLLFFDVKLFKTKLQIGNPSPNTPSLTENKGILLQNHNAQPIKHPWCSTDI